MGQYRFSMAPNISVPRSKFKMPFNHVTSFNHGKLIPIDCFEVLPGDEFKLDLSAIIRMSTPIAPIFGNIKAHVHAFFVPMRLVWEHTQEFYGENKTSAGYQTNSYSIPSSALDQSSMPGDIVVGSVSNYLGKPLCVSDNRTIKMSVLKERGYYLIYNEYYRAQQLIGPVLLSVADTGDVGTIQGGNLDYTVNTTIGWSTVPMNVCKEFDYFTACTTAPQYGSAVTLPLGASAPVIAGSTVHSTNGAVKLYKNGVNSDLIMNGNNNGLFLRGAATTSGTAQNVDTTNLIADLSNATAASINSIRYAFACQKWLERANFGSRFFEMLNLHYGITSPDARLQRPEYLGGRDFYINVDQVISTAGYAAGSTQEVGQTGAISVTGAKCTNLFHKAFVEPGYVYILISTTHERTYSQGILREDTRADRFDFYFPEFANLGDQSVYSKEIYFDDAAASAENAVFGYQEHWAEYRYRPNRVSGIMNPNASGGLVYWTLAEQLNSRPTLSKSFICEDRRELTRCLVSGSTGPDYIADFYFDYTAVREMPLYTIPGLVDHFGTL